MESNSATTNPEKDCGAFGVLFQTIINDLRGSSPIWEDFIYKAMKLHTSLKTTVVAITAFLESFQKVADMATGSKGATKEIGSALTRLCMRHKSIESNLQALTSSIVSSLVGPLQDKLEDWKKGVATLDKEHAKEYKKARQDIKKAASDTLRLQKKVRKGTGGGSHGKADMQMKLDTAMQDVTAKYQHLEETERNSVRSALIEERGRFCHFITCLKPFVDQELKLLTEITHIHEIMDSLCYQAAEPSALPASSEQVILDLKGLDNSAWNINQGSEFTRSILRTSARWYKMPRAREHPSPPSSPSSLGSRKSSMCSINSLTSNSSGSSKSHSPSHTMHKRTPSQPVIGAVRLTSVSSQDSGFRSQDTLFLRPHTPQSLNLFKASSSNQDKEGDGDCDSTPTTPSDNTPSASSTWNNWPNPPGAPRIDPTRPHTISSAYEKGHGRPALKPDMFEPPASMAQTIMGPPVEMRNKPPSRSLSQSGSSSNSQNRPSAQISKMQPVLPPHSSKPKVKVVAPPVLPPGAQPIYANMSEISQRSSSQSEMSPDDEPTTPTTPAGLTNNPQGPRSPLVRMNLDEAIEQMDLCTAALNVNIQHQAIPEEKAEEVTPRPSTSDPSGANRESLFECSKPKLQQDTSLELAKAIRELEASTAALTSAYDTDNFNKHPPGPQPPNVTTSAAPMPAPSSTGGDSDSYTSRSSLPSSSGYGTMNSTPAGSEDTIASGGPHEASVAATTKVGENAEQNDGEDGEDSASPSAQEDDKFEPEKSLTLPRSGDGRTSYRPPIFPKRPASTTGIPLARRSSVNTPKPPPPVRRTASIAGATPSHVQKLRSPPRQMSDCTQPLQQQQHQHHHHQQQYHQHQQQPQQSPPIPPPPMAGGDGPYAELQLIQQSIHHHQQQQHGPDQHHYQANPAGHYAAQQQMMAPPHSAPILVGQGDPRVALNRQPSYPGVSGSYPNHAENSSAGGPAAPVVSGTTGVMESLNAKFASLNSQYQDYRTGQPSPMVPHTAPPPSKAPPPVTMQKPKVGVPPPPSSMMGGGGPQYAQPHPDGAGNHLGQGYPPSMDPQQYNNRLHSQGHPVQGQHPHMTQQQLHQYQQQQQQQQQRIAQGQYYPQQQQHPAQQPIYSETGPHYQQQQQQHHHPQYQHQHQHHHKQHQPPLPSTEEDFPLPPTAEELQEIERVYSRPAPIGSNVRAAPPTSQKPGQAKRPSVSGNPQDSQLSLMMELKRRVSVDDSSEA